MDDLAADSLDLLEIALAIEDNLGLTLPHQFLGGARMSNRSHRKRRRIVAGGLTLLLLLGPSAQAFAESAAEQRLRVLEETLRKTQEEVQELHRQLDQQKAATQETQKKVDEAATSARTASADAKKAVSLPDWLSRTTVFGDVRYRHEGFYHQPHAKKAVVTARNRERIRARLGVRVALTDELSATIRGASGNINDPISTNETLTGNFNRKSFNLDWAYLTFTPGQSFGIRPGAIAFTAGKFPNPIFRTDEMVFDEDISAEGLSQTFQLLGQPLGALDQVKLHALEWTFNEISNKEDGWMFGGQVNPSLHFGDLQLEAGLGQYWWLNPDQIAQALSRNTTAFTASGAPVANSAFNSSLVNTNLLVTKTIQPPTTTPGKKPAAFTAITGYKSGFNQSNAVLAATVPHLVLAQPLRFWADYIYNWDAATDDAHGWTSGLRLGQTKVKGDWSVFGFYEHLGQEAAISAFTFSDFGTAGTNVEGPGVGIEYQLLNPLTISAKGYFTNFINRPADNTNPTLTRFQLDALVKF
ncbi:MAG TPA: putative porin [Methylomirabilota bacterium]